MRKIILLFGAVLALASCGKNTEYAIDGQLQSSEFEGAQVYLVDIATRQPVDSTLMSNGSFHFEGNIENPYIAYVVAVGANGNAQTACVVEPGKIYVNLDSDSLSGTPLNDTLYAFTVASHEVDYSLELSIYMALYRSAVSAEDRHEAETAYDSIDALRIADMSIAALNTYKYNKDNIVGAYVLTLWATESHPKYSQAEEMLEGASDVVKNYTPLQNILSQLQAIESTDAGKKYIDIEGIDFATGEAGKLSQLVDGRVALVDFWASWCRPCRQEISENLVRIYKQYSKKGLQVVGVDVWDKPEQHKQAVEQLGITYPQLIDTTRNATTTYGISGIPQILLIGADGTIIARDLRGADIEAAVIEALK